MQSSEINTKKSWQKFEDNTYNKWFPASQFNCIHRTPDFKYFSKFVNPASLKPDFQFRIKEDGKKFWVECKDRHIKENDNSFRLFKSGQRERYSRETNVFIFIRLTQCSITKYYLVPLSELNTDVININQLQAFRIWNNSYIKPALIKRYIQSHTSFFQMFTAFPRRYVNPWWTQRYFSM